MNRRVVITGAAHGLGLALVNKFAAQGASVLAVDVEAMESSCAARSMRCDLAAADCGDRVLAAAIDQLGGCDTLINNAAWSYHRSFPDVTPADFDRLVAINQRAPFLLTQSFVREFDRATEKPTDPCVVNISSVNAVSGNLNLAAYAGTKGALEAMTRAFAVELAPRRIRVNAIRPGAIDTPNYREAMANGSLKPEEYWRDFLVKQPSSADQVADVVTFLCSPSASTVTGSIWTIDGGFLAH